jgi:transposase
MVGLRLPRCTTNGLPAKIAELGDRHATLRATLQPLANSIVELSEQIRSSEKKLAQMCERFPEAVRIRGIHGVGPITALTFVLVVDDPNRFTRTRDIGPYLGLAPRQDQTGQSDPALHISKAGNRYLRGLLTQCAKKILRKDSPETDLKRWGSAIAARGGKRANHVATVAVARRLAVTMLAVWKSGEDYVPNREVATATAT